MKQIRKRATFANVMSIIAVFLAIGGATAIAASQLAKNSVGSKQIKKNAVTTKKIKNNAVTAAKIKNNAVTGAKLQNGAVTSAKIAGGAVGTGQLANGAVGTGQLADKAVTGAKIDSGSTPFTQVVYRAKGNAAVPFTGGQLYPISNPNYTQPAGQVDQYIGSMEVRFGAACAPPRIAQAYLLIDAANPASPTPTEILGLGILEDKTAGEAIRQMNFSPLGIGFASTLRGASASPIGHTFSLFMLGSACTSGSGVDAVGGGVDVLGTK